MIAKQSEILAEIDRRRADLTRGLVRIYNYYRVLVGFALLAKFIRDQTRHPRRNYVLVGVHHVHLR